MAEELALLPTTGPLAKSLICWMVPRRCSVSAWFQS